METRVAEVKVVGEVRAVKLRDAGGGVFLLRLEDGRVVAGRFTPKQESALTNTLRHRHRLAIIGRGRFNADGDLSSILRIKKCGIVQPGKTPGTKTRWSISRRTRKPQTGLAANPAHYLYGAPEPGETVDSLAGQAVAAAAGQTPESVGGVNLAEVFAEIREKYPVGKDDVEPPADFAANYKHYLYGFPKEDV